MQRFKILWFTVVTTFALYAQPKYNEQILSTSGGTAVAMDKEWALVGDADSNQTFIYNLNYAKMQNVPMDMWELKQTLTAPAHGKYGSSVSVSGELALISAPKIVTAPVQSAWKMEVGTATISDSNVTTVHLKRRFDIKPLIFILDDNSIAEATSVRIKSVDFDRFEAFNVQPENLKEPGLTSGPMPIRYLAITPGDHIIPDGSINGLRIIAKVHNTNSVKQRQVPFPDQGTWDNISITPSMNS